MMSLNKKAEGKKTEQTYKKKFLELHKLHTQISITVANKLGNKFTSSPYCTSSHALLFYEAGIPDLEEVLQYQSILKLNEKQVVCERKLNFYPETL